jgi:hypothetical protein
VAAAKQEQLLHCEEFCCGDVRTGEIISWCTLSKLLVARILVRVLICLGGNLGYFTIYCILNFVKAVTDSDLYLCDLSESVHILKSLTCQSSWRLCSDLNAIPLLPQDS